MCLKYAKTAYQILIKICPTKTCTITSKEMTLDQLFIVKQSIIIYKIQARFIRLKSACVPSTNTFPYFMRPLHRE